MSELIEVKELEVDFLPWLSSVLQVIYKLEHGLSVSADVPCGTCTLCCEGQIRTVLQDNEVEHPLYEAVKDGSTWIIPKDENKRCIHLGSNGCNIHASRPGVCRSFDCRKRMVANMADPATLEMAKQWDMSRWHIEENDLFIAAIRSAALNYQKADPGAGISKITAYAITHFQQYLGPVYLRMKAKKSDWDGYDGGR